MKTKRLQLSNDSALKVRTKLRAGIDIRDDRGVVRAVPNVALFAAADSPTERDPASSL